MSDCQHTCIGGDSTYCVRTHADIAKLRPRSSTCANSFQGTPGTPGARITPRLFFLLRGASFFVRVPLASSMATAGGGGGGGRVSGEACRTINSKKLESQLDLAGQAGPEEPPPKATYARPMPFSCRSRLFLSPISCTEERTVNIASSAMCPGLEMTHKNRRQCSSAGLPAYSSTSPEPVSGLHHASTPSASFLIPGDHSCHPIFLSGQRSLLPFR